MAEQLKARMISERTRAEILFENGHERTMTSEWADSQQGRGYDGGHWGPFPSFRNEVEESISDAQRMWGMPGATIRYYRETRTVETVERVTEVSAFYSERTCRPAVPGGESDGVNRR